MPEPYKLIEFVEHYPGGFQRGTQRGVPSGVADRLVKDGFARILGTIGDAPPAPEIAAPIERHPEPHRAHQSKRERERTR